MPCNLITGHTNSQQSQVEESGTSPKEKQRQQQEL